MYSHFTSTVCLDAVKCSSWLPCPQIHDNPMNELCLHCLWHHLRNVASCTRKTFSVNSEVMTTCKPILQEWPIFVLLSGLQSTISNWSRLIEFHNGPGIHNLIDVTKLFTYIRLFIKTLENKSIISHCYHQILYNWLCCCHYVWRCFKNLVLHYMIHQWHLVSSTRVLAKWNIIYLGMYNNETPRIPHYFAVLYYEFEYVDNWLIHRKYINKKCLKIGKGMN